MNRRGGNNIGTHPLELYRRTVYDVPSRPEPLRPLEIQVPTAPGPTRAYRCCVTGGKACRYHRAVNVDNVQAQGPGITRHKAYVQVWIVNKPKAYVLSSRGPGLQGCP